MAPRQSHFNPEQFKETHLVRGRSVNILSEEGLQQFAGQVLDVHGHKPASVQLGRPIYSVLHKNKVVGQVEDITLKDARIKVDQYHLKKALKNPSGGKERHTFLRGEYDPAQTFETNRAMSFGMGTLVDKKTGRDISTGMTAGRLGPDGATYRP